MSEFILNIPIIDIDNPNLLGIDPTSSGFNPSLLNQPSTTSPSAVTTRFIRKNDVVFIADSMCPDKTANLFFDQTNINGYCQKPNKLTLTVGTNASDFGINEGIINNSTNAFARVISASDNLLYVNQNYITANILAFGANTLSGSDYSEGDLIYQTTSLTDTTVNFRGKVEFYDSANGILAITPTSGVVNAVLAAANSVIRKINSNILSNAASIIQGNLFPNSTTLRSTLTPSKTATITASEHRSGAFIRYSGSDIVIGNEVVSGDIIGSTIRFTSGSGTGESRTITGVSGARQLTLSSAISGLTSNTRYSIGNHVVDDYGKICGVFNIPESEDLKFPVGERVFTITDTATAVDNEYIMRATGTYRVVGRPAEPINPSTTSTNPSTPVVAIPTRRRRKRDPLAQTFFTPADGEEIVNGLPSTAYGIYVSSIDLWFKSKPDIDSNQDALPVFVQLVEVVNGLPTEKVLAVATVPWRNVKTTDMPHVDNDVFNYTKFSFPDPVYLKPDTEYAMVVLSDSPEYSVYVSELGGTLLGSSPARRVSEQPYAGSLFKSQNASTWTPIQNQDLMFRINKCVFTSNQLGVATFKPTPPLANVYMDSLLIHSSEINHQPTISRYKFRSNNVLNITDSQFIYLPPNQIYRFGADLSTSTKTSNRRRVVRAGDRNSFTAGIELSSTNPDVSPVINLERFGLLGYESFIDNGSLSNNNITVTSPGNHVDASQISVTIPEPNIPGGIKANAYIIGLTGDGEITRSNIVFDVIGSGYSGNVEMTITEAGATNATVVVSSEVSSFGGNAKARYITKPVNLADGFDAGDLRVFIDCNRPVGTHIEIYYKVRSSSDPQTFSEKKWQLMERVTNSFSIDQNQIIELQYRPYYQQSSPNKLIYTENGIDYPLGGTFKQFAIKVVLLADDSTVAPTLRNMRVIATPSG